MVASTTWTFEEDKAFEVALARYFTDSDRWTKIASLLHHKTAADVQQRFWALEVDIRRIEDGGGRTAGTAAPPPMIPMQAPPMAEPKKTKVDATALAAAGDRRKGVPWSEEEHRLFLLGLNKFGKGDWRSIARNFVTTRTPTQVASHAQKYFIRLNSMNKKDKRRASIHDITSTGQYKVGQGAGCGSKASGNMHMQQAHGGHMGLPSVYM